MENDEYLKDGFDAQTLNMSAIRGLLVKHSVAYPANAKKPQLVTLLHETVLSKASKLRKEAKRQRRAKADGRDIEQVGTSKTDDRSAKQASTKTDERSAKQAGTKAIGSRTRSQTPRTERTRAPQFPSQLKDQDSSEKPSRDEKKTQKDKKPSRDVKKAQKDDGDKETKRTKKPKTKKVERPVGSPPRAVGKASDVKRTGNKRKLSDGEQDVSADSGDDRVFTPHRVRAKQPVRPREPEAGNFSDENPFQSSPEAARKRRRKAEVKPTTPMSALRKSQPSGVSFRVALPSDAARQNSNEEEEEDEVMTEPPKPLFEVTEDEEMEESVQEKPRAKVSELVARYQQAPAKVDRPRSPTVRIRDGLHASEAPKPVVEPVVEAATPVVRPAEQAPAANPVIRSEPTNPVIRPEQIKPVARPELVKPDQPKRFTMTPDALREIAAGQNDPQRRRTVAANGLPPVAPGIPVMRTDARVGRERLAGEPANEPLSFEQAAREAHELQRRRVATLRQHVESAAAASAAAGSDAKTHSRRSSIASIASSVGEARGIPAIPAAQQTQSQETQPGRKQHTSWTVRLLWAAAVGAAALTWRAHEQFAVGFGSARAEYAPLAPPNDSILAEPQPPAADAVWTQHAVYYAQTARAWIAPPPLECPEHADCVPYTAIPAAAAHGSAALSSAARDQWIVSTGGQRVAVVQCDAGHVLQFPALTSRVYPLVPQCVRDVPTEHRVRQLVAVMLRECRARRGRAECQMSLMEQARGLRAQQSDDDEADAIERLGISSADLHALMSRRKAPRLSDDEFDALFRLAAAELASGDAVTAFELAYEDDDDETTFYVARDAEYPPFCHVQRLVLRAVVGHVPALLALIGAGVLSFVASRRFGAYRAESRAADALVGSALARLKRQARRHYVDPALSPSPAIPSLQLRDLLLLSSGTPPASSTDVTQVYFDPRARSSVWERVRHVVERNANVRCRTTAVRGEPMRVWEWIGPLDEDDDEIMSPFSSPQRI
ncbi:hypothetical protein IWW56_001765 [Coemansia sp. RSA 2131]|nr:hypothetical protein IWW56_001765 [Coemansia sp. RSA 2131]